MRKTWTLPKLPSFANALNAYNREPFGNRPSTSIKFGLLRFFPMHRSASEGQTRWTKAGVYHSKPHTSVIGREYSMPSIFPDAWPKWEIHMGIIADNSVSHGLSIRCICSIRTRTLARSQNQHHTKIGCITEKLSFDQWPKWSCEWLNHQMRIKLRKSTLKFRAETKQRWTELDKVRWEQRGRKRKKEETGLEIGSFCWIEKPAEIWLTYVTVCCR